ncbi:hypothetical protein CXG81DRAFT_15884 [Caulochytrium protostelioides]|uniref:Nucleic acid-binding protein n=1 Tax=Caulochytrium protostelioides TaxID=1555241 RepID=A0A4P9WRB0_9FUNG|nr:nucleic acid-binding protein [Caulochytrium protostelioides]RKO98473.1 hypothetical protein CXG81DRAFT_15884 [Caulochytrium protostelioides]|eukprot:RKO98473.1 hypothetical protein CXG81DRAFT_15884 [Caulochytrium protostelioides]
MPTLFHADAQTATKLLAEAAASATTEAPAAAAAPAKEKKAKKTKPAPVVADPISKLDIVVGKIVDVRKHPDADSLYVEQIDCGEAEPREICSGLVKYMQPEQLLNKEVLVLRNLKPVAMRGIKSFGMVLCASNAAHDQIEFCTPPAGSIPGDLVRVDGFPREPDAQINKKLFEKVQPKFRVSDDLAATYDGQPWVTNRGAITVASLAGGSIS